MIGTRSSCLSLATLAVACATPPDRADYVPDLEVELYSDASAARPIVFVEITNRSRTPICIRAEALRNPFSHEMDLSLRNRGGRTYRLLSLDLVAAPLEGIVRVDPGERVRGEYSLARFRGISPTRALPPGLTARASFRYGYCADVWSLRATTGWRPI